MRPLPPPQVHAQIPPLPQAQNDPTMNVLELENPTTRTEEEKRRKGETKDAMPIKQTQQRVEKMKDVDPTLILSQEEVGMSKRKKISRRWINIDDFLLGRGSSAYSLAANVSAQGSSITWP